MFQQLAHKEMKHKLIGLQEFLLFIKEAFVQKSKHGSLESNRTCVSPAQLKWATGRAKKNKHEETPRASTGFPLDYLS